MLVVHGLGSKLCVHGHARVCNMHCAIGAAMQCNTKATMCSVHGLHLCAACACVLCWAVSLATGYGADGLRRVGIVAFCA